MIAPACERGGALRGAGRTEDRFASGAQADTEVQPEGAARRNGGRGQSQTLAPVSALPPIAGPTVDGQRHRMRVRISSAPLPRRGSSKEEHDGLTTDPSSSTRRRAHVGGIPRGPGAGYDSRAPPRPDALRANSRSTAGSRPVVEDCPTDGLTGRRAAP